MKLLIINTVPTEKNGITNVIFNYLSAIDCEGLVIDILSLNQPNQKYVDMVKQKGGKMYVLPRSKDHITRYWKELRKLIKNNGYDIVHIHGNSHTTFIELSAAYAAGCVVRMIHAHNTMCKHVLVHRILTPLFNMLCTNGLACGKEAGRFMFGYKPFTVINNGVDTDKFAFNTQIREKLRNKMGWTDCKVIGHVGYFTEVKNQSFIVDIFECLYENNPDYRLVLIGDGPMREEIKKKIDSKGLGNKVCMTGNIDNVNEYLNAIDMIVMPSLFEGLPLTLIEQQANGLPCVVADTITREADKTGNIKFLSMNSPVEEWAKAVMEEDGKSRDERSRKAIEDITLAGYNIKEQALKLADFYNAAVEN